jgi:hypothetical protein
MDASNAFKKNRNDFSCVAFHKGRKIAYMKYVHKIQVYMAWLKKNNIPFDYINVYWRRNGLFFKRFYNNT